MEVIEIARLMRRDTSVPRDVNERTLDIVLILVFAERELRELQRAKIKNLSRARSSFVHAKLFLTSRVESAYIGCY